MKNIYLYLLIALLTISCKHKHDDHDGHDHGNESHKEQSKDNHDDHDHAEGESHDHDDHSKNEKGHDDHGHEEHGTDIHLTAEQLSSAKIATGVIKKIKISERIEVTGSIEAPPENTATVYTPLEAFVFKANLLLGDKVKKGQVIATLQHPNFTDLQYNFLEANNKLKVAKEEFKRKEMLFKNDIASKKSFLLAESKYTSAKNLVKNFSSQLKMAGLSPNTIAKKGIQQYVYVKSPISGYIVKNNLNQGKFLNANSVMMEIIDNDHMHAELNVFNTDANRIKEKDKFVFKTSGSDKVYEGYIKLISQGIDNKTKTINVHGHFHDEDRLLKVGSYINAQILIGGELTYAVPEDAVIDFEGKKVIFKAEGKNEFEPLEVKTGYSEKGYIAIKSIEKNDFNISIVTKGAHILKGELLKSSGEMDGHGHAH